MEQPHIEPATEQPHAKPRRSGCLKWSCGCLAAAALAAFAAAALGWHFLNRWDEGQSPWANLPPTTEWAIEGYDIKRLLDRGLDDPGLLALLRMGAARLDDLSGGDGSFAGRLERFVEYYRLLSFAYHAAAPNIATIGRGTHTLFAVVRPSPWLKLLLGDGAAVAYSDDLELYCATRDGWLVLADNAAQVDEVLLHWDGREQPFGPAPETDGAYLAVGLRSEDGEGANAVAAASGQPAPGLLGIANPFAEPPARAEAARVAGLLFRPLADGWEIFAWRGEEPADPVARVAAELPEEVPFAVAGGENMEIAARLSPEAQARFSESLLRRAEFPPDAPHRFAVGRHWLRDLWLGRVGRDATLLLGEPAEGDFGFAPLPRAALGWRWGDAPGADEFIDGLTVWLDALGAPGGDAVADAARMAARYREIPLSGGRAVALELPPPFLGGARPTWAVGDDRLGWLASEPSAVPGKDVEGALLVGTLSEPGTGLIRWGAAWNMSPEFRDGAIRFFGERWRALPAGWRAGEDRVMTGIGWLAYFLTAYPRGGLAALSDTEGRAVLLHIEARSE